MSNTDINNLLLHLKENKILYLNIKLEEELLRNSISISSYITNEEEYKYSSFSESKNWIAIFRNIIVENMNSYIIEPKYRPLVHDVNFKVLFEFDVIPPNFHKRIHKNYYRCTFMFRTIEEFNSFFTKKITLREKLNLL